MRGAVLILALILSGCKKPLTNEEIIKQEKICANAGLVAHEFTTEFNQGLIVEIQCGRKYQ